MRRQLHGDCVGEEEQHVQYANFVLSGPLWLLVPDAQLGVGPGRTREVERTLADVGQDEGQKVEERVPSVVSVLRLHGYVLS